jgi:hypothetical protein
MTRLWIKRLFVAMAVSCGVLLVWAYFQGPPSFSKLKGGCAITLQKDPRAEALEAWLIKNRIPYQKREAPYDGMFKEILGYNGISQTEVEQSKSCIFIENVPLRGGFLASHLAYGYFVFRADGSPITYRIFDVYQFL